MGWDGMKWDGVGKGEGEANKAGRQVRVYGEGRHLSRRQDGEEVSISEWGKRFRCATGDVAVHLYCWICVCDDVCYDAKSAAAVG
jgi:hypothetical protein